MNNKISWLQNAILSKGLWSMLYLATGLSVQIAIHGPQSLLYITTRERTILCITWFIGAIIAYAYDKRNYDVLERIKFIETSFIILFLGCGIYLLPISLNNQYIATLPIFFLIGYRHNQKIGFYE